MRFATLRCLASDSLLQRSNKLSRADLVDNNARVFVYRRQAAQRAEAREIAAYDRRQTALMMSMDDSPIVGPRRSAPSQRYSSKATWHLRKDGSRRNFRQRDLQVKRDWAIGEAIGEKDKIFINKLNKIGVKVNESLTDMLTAWRKADENKFFDHANGLMDALEQSIPAFSYLKMREAQRHVRPRLPREIHIGWNWSLFQDIHNMQYLHWERYGRISECGLIVVQEMEALATIAGVALPGLLKKQGAVFQNMLKHLQENDSARQCVSQQPNGSEDIIMVDADEDVMEFELSQGSNDSVKTQSSLLRSFADTNSPNISVCSSANTSFTSSLGSPILRAISATQQPRETPRSAFLSLPLNGITKFKRSLPIDDTVAPGNVSKIRALATSIPSGPARPLPIAQCTAATSSYISVTTNVLQRNDASTNESEKRLLDLFANDKFKLEITGAIARVVGDVTNKKPLAATDVATIIKSCNWIIKNHQRNWFDLQTIITNINVDQWWRQMEKIVLTLQGLGLSQPKLEVAEALREIVELTQAIRNGEAAKGASKDEVVKGMGAFDCTQMVNQKSFLAFFANPHFRARVPEVMQMMIRKLGFGGLITTCDTEILTRSSQWLIDNRNKSWFDRDNIVLDDCVGEYKAHVALFLSKLHNFRKRHASKELDFMQAQLEKAEMVFEGKVLSQHKLGKAVESYESVPSGDPSLSG